MLKKKLLITASTFPRWEGDTEPRFILDYAKTMTKYYEVHVLVPSAIGAMDEEMMEGVIVHRYHYFPIHGFETLCYPGAIVPRIKEKKIRLLLVPFLFLGMKRAIKKYSRMVDIVHAHWLIPQGIMQRNNKDVPYILTGHGGDVTSLNFWPVIKMKKMALENASQITTVSNSLYKTVQEMVPNDKTSIIPMGCDITRFSVEKKIDNYFGQGKKKVVLFVGRLAEKKGVTYLIDSMRYVDDAILYIVGKGSLETKLKEQAKPLGDKVVFLGPKTHEELPEIYASADVFVAPSITASDGDKEGFGLVIIEAMASGIPVVASRSGGIVDIIKDSENGLLCNEKDVDDLANKIKIVINQPDIREKIINNGLITARENSYRAVGERYKEVIEKILCKE